MLYVWYSPPILSNFAFMLLRAAFHARLVCMAAERSFLIRIVFYEGKNTALQTAFVWA